MHWAVTNPHAVAPVLLFDAKVTAWCSISGIVLFGPYIFEEATPSGFVTCSVIASRCTAMLQNYVIPELLHRNALNDIVWMQDGAPSRKAMSVRRVLEQHFSDPISHAIFFSVASETP